MLDLHCRSLGNHVQVINGAPKCIPSVKKGSNPYKTYINLLFRLFRAAIIHLEVEVCVQFC